MRASESEPDLQRDRESDRQRDCMPKRKREQFPGISSLHLYISKQLALGAPDVGHNKNCAAKHET